MTIKTNLTAPVTTTTTIIETMTRIITVIVTVELMPIVRLFSNINNDSESNRNMIMTM